MTNLKSWCYEWFNASARADWNNLTIDEILADIACLDDVPGTAAEVFEAMTEIIAEYDVLNAKETK